MYRNRTQRGDNAAWTPEDSLLFNPESIAMIVAEQNDTGYPTVVEWAKVRKPAIHMRHAALAAIGLRDGEGF